METDPTLPPTPKMRRRLLTDILRDVSRAFYLTLRILPEGVREPVGLAYLLARAADTVADTPVLAPPVRLLHLLEFREQVEGPASLEVLEHLRQETRGTTPGEEAMLEALPGAFALLEAQDIGDRLEVRRIVGILIRGMEMDLRTFPGALSSAEDLDEYIWLVAGCVGEFWTRSTMAHLPALRRWSPLRMVELGSRFGKALQLVNILRDLPRDLKAGRCYLPARELAALGLGPQDLTAENLPRAWPVLERWVRITLDHFAAAEEYALAIPFYCLRLRLAVLWPILIGKATLARLVRNPGWLDARVRVKVGRTWMYRMLFASVPAALCSPLLRFWFRSQRRRVERALDGGPPVRGRPRR